MSTLHEELLAAITEKYPKEAVALAKELTRLTAEAAALKKDRTALAEQRDDETRKAQKERIELQSAFTTAQKLVAAALKIATAEEQEVVPKGGEVSSDCSPKDKEMAFFNGYWSAAHNIAHDIAALTASSPELAGKVLCDGREVEELRRDEERIEAHERAWKNEECGVGILQKFTVLDTYRAALDATIAARQPTGEDKP